MYRIARVKNENFSVGETEGKLITKVGAFSAPAGTIVVSHIAFANAPNAQAPVRIHPEPAEISVVSVPSVAPTPSAARRQDPPEQAAEETPSKCCWPFSKCC